MTDDKSELAALRKRIEQLEEKAKPPEKKEFKPQPYEPIDWTARMSMPRSAIEAMVAAEPRNFMRDVVRDNRGPTSPSGMIPSSQQASGGGAAPGGGSGWGAATPLGPPPGVAQADKLMDAQDRRDRIELAQRIAAHEAAMLAAQKGKG